MLGAVAVYQARPYLKVANEYPTAKRTIKEVETYSAGPAAWFAASSENRVWGGVTSGARAKVHSKNESVFFPGGLVLVLALIGLIGGSIYTRRLRLALALGILTCSILALGFGLDRRRLPLPPAVRLRPGLGRRARAWPDLHAGDAVLRAARGRGRATAGHNRGRLGRRHSVRALPGIVGVVLVIGLVGEGAGHLGHPVVPQPAKAEIGLPGPVLDLPTDGALDRIWQYFSTDGFYKIPVGESTFDIPAIDDLRGGMNGFPDRASVEKLRYYGIKTVVLHTVIPPGLPPEQGWVIAEPPDPAAAAKKPIAGLGITKRQVGSVVPVHGLL